MFVVVGKFDLAPYEEHELVYSPVYLAKVCRRLCLRPSFISLEVKFIKD